MIKLTARRVASSASYEDLLISRGIKESLSIEGFDENKWDCLFNNTVFTNKNKMAIYIKHVGLFTFSFKKVAYMYGIVINKTGFDSQLIFRKLSKQMNGATPLARVLSTAAFLKVNGITLKEYSNRDEFNKFFEG